jgi:FkbM family methyltransferase
MARAIPRATPPRRRRTDAAVASASRSSHVGGHAFAWIEWVGGRAASLHNHVQSLGLAATAVYAAQKLRFRLGPPKTPFVWLLSKQARHPLRCRPGTSDIAVFGQIFRDLEYRCLDDIGDPGLVIDCGANVGYSSAYFLSRFPNAKVIAVEPDAANFAVLEANVAPYGDRCEVLNTGLWSHPTGLVMSEQAWGDGREWARTVRVARPREAPAMTATDVGTLLAGSGFDRISILKVDIEGSESVVFASNYESWIGKVDNMVIELHGEREREVVLGAIAAERFETSTSGELFVCKRRTARAKPW